MSSLAKELARFTDAECAKNILQQHLPEFSDGHLVINACRILRTRLKTYLKAASHGKAALSLCYQLDVTDNRRRQRGTQILFVKVFCGGRSQVEFQNLQPARLAPPAFGNACVHLPELDAIVWAFPNDPCLPHLPEVVDPVLVKQYLPYDRLPIDADADFEAKVEVIHYYPEQRCTCRYDLAWGSSDGPQTFTLFGKTFCDESGRELYRRMSYFGEKTRERPNGLAVAQPLGYDEKSKTIWQQAVAGKPLLAVLDETNYETLLAAVAKGLAALHQSDFSGLPLIKLNELLLELRKKAAKLARAFPQWQDRLQAILASLGKNAPDLARSAPALIHGDFQAKQLLVQDGKVFIFDFDELACGDSLQDVASFIVDLHLHDFAPSMLQRMAKTFSRSYFSYIDREGPMENLNWHIRFQLVTKAYRMLTYWRHQSGAMSDIQSLLNLASGTVFIL